MRRPGPTRTIAHLNLAGDLAVACGFLLVVAGSWIVSVPLALIVGGLGLIGLGTWAALR